MLLKLSGVYRVKLLFLPNYCVKYYDYIVKWCNSAHVNCNWYVSLDNTLILLILPLKINNHIC